MNNLNHMTTMASESFLMNVKEETNCILAEIVRLAAFVSKDFLDPASSKYKLLVLDFNYFTRAAHYEKLIEENEELQDSLYNTYGDLLSRFSTLFQTVANFISSIKEYCDQVGQERVGISYLDIVDIEVLFNVGLVLLYLEKYLPGPVRERIYVAIYRNSDERRNVDFLVDFLRMSSAPSEPCYLFERLMMNDSFVEKCLSCCETIHREGVNDFGKTYVDRITLVKWIFVCLLFKPSTLKSDFSKMRQIVEDFFRDEWVLQLGLGLNVNLLDSWQPYRAAITALTNQVDTNKAKDMAAYHYNALSKLTVPQGKILPNDFDANIRLVSLYNSSLRWLILHTSKTSTKKALSYVQAIDIYPQFEEQSLALFLRVSSFEMDFLTAYRDALRNKEENIKKVTSSTCAIISEMAQLFTQDFGSLNKEKKTKLHNWFLLMKKTLEELELNYKRNAEFVSQVKRRITQVGEMLDLGGNLSVAQFLHKLESQLDYLSALYNVREEEERRIQRSAEPAYMWPILDDWTPRIQRRILESSNVHAIRALFFKLSLSINVLCEQFQSEERKTLIGRAYSFHLERRLRAILQTIPNRLFSVLKTTLSPSLQRQWEPTLDKSAAREMADFDENFCLAEATYTISNLSLGVSRMALKKVGIVSINPKELLEEGIRRELALELPPLLTSLDKVSLLEDVLSNLTDNLQLFRRAFIYMCEHVDINGHDMWREEVDSLVRQMANDLKERKLPNTPKSSKSGTPVPALAHIFNLLLKHSDPYTNRYFENSMTWREVKTNKDVLTSRTIDLIESWIPSSAINSLRSILNYFMGILINDSFKQINSIVTAVGNFSFDDSFVHSDPYEQLLRQIQGNQALVQLITKVGQHLLLLNMLCQSKKQHCQLHAAPLFSSLAACDKFLLSHPNSVPDDIGPIVSLLRDCGLCTPTLTLHKTSVVPSPRTSVCLLLTLYIAMHRFNGTRRDSFCGRTFIAGMFFLLHQINEVEEFRKMAERFADLLVVSKGSNDKQLLLSHISNVVTFS
ncbi:hypothetical protein Y032_0204g1866 [Ancylostoma ceylanicum]|uniref:WASH complex subunit strumpellin n=1 Tax=Ancylostoma ceylanicum TaxID=53326 RepID=A0A016SMM6_9BILA|nr:hypothetical protein Y032_0204g1866 [Ancylostoma ceylanicum]